MIYEKFLQVYADIKRDIDNSKFIIDVLPYVFEEDVLSITSVKTGKVIFYFNRHQMKFQYKTSLTPKYLEEIRLSNIQDIKIVNGSILIVDDVLAIKLLE